MAMSDAAHPLNGTTPRKARKTVAKVARKVESEARSFAAEAEDARDKLVATAIKRIRTRRRAAQAWARGRAEVAGEAVQTRPVTAIATALGVGVIIGLLARR
jgi:ElaB/YqjD/DUF883 family membrane-anchored ribosome-binding protein